MTISWILIVSEKKKMARKTKSRKIPKQILVLGEGQSERQYFIEMQRHEDSVFALKPELPKSQDYGHIFRYAINNAEEHQKVFCLIDIDYILNQNKYEEYKAEQNKALKVRNIVVCESCPCFETWFVLHFEEVSKPFTYCDSLISEKLQNRIQNYKKADSKRNYYALLKNKQQDAINRAEVIVKRRNKEIATGLHNPRVCRIPFTEIHLLIKELLEI